MELIAKRVQPEVRGERDSPNDCADEGIIVKKRILLFCASGLILLLALLLWRCMPRQKASEQALRTSMEKIAKACGVTIEEPLEFGPEKRDVILPESAYSVTTKNNLHFSVRSRTRKVIGFYASREEVPYGLKSKDTIPKEKALESAKRVLEALGVNVPLTAERARYVDAVETEPDDLEGAEWVFNETGRFLGIPLIGGRAKVSVSAYSGKVLAFSTLSGSDMFTAIFLR